MKEKNIGKGKNILVIEDDNSILNMYKTSLTNDGYSVFTAVNGEDGLKIAQKEIPDLVLLDVMMPQVDGFAVLEQLKAESATDKIPVIMLTNLAQEEDRERGKKLGAKDYLVKSNLTPMQVSEKIKKYIK